MTGDGSRIKRALYRAHHRGTKEMDLILGRFADAELANLSEAELEAFEAVMLSADQHIDGWLKGAEPPPAVKPAIERIRRYHRLES
jgi:antitoxin CptB